MNLTDTDIKSIIIFRALQLGDMLCSIPAIRALRSAFPYAHITLAGLPWARTLVDRFPDYFDDFIHFPGYPGLPEQTFSPREVLSFLDQVQSRSFDLAIQMQGNGSIVNPLIELFGAKNIAGFCTAGHYCPVGANFIVYPETVHEVERHLTLMNSFGIPSKGTFLEFPLKDSDYADLEAANLPITPENYVCVHPGSRGAYRQWPPENFARLADFCHEQGLSVVITGTQEEMPLVEEVMKHMEHPAINAAGRTSLGAVAALIKNAFALISNCTGVSHIAAALKIPSVVISLDGEPERWGPMDKELHRTLDGTKGLEFEKVLNELEEVLVVATQRD
jgi:ADP-heptose:LPS heptosyltransferase